MKTLVSATLLTVLAGTSGAFALPPIPSSIDTGYSDNEQAGDDANYRSSGYQSELYRDDANGSATGLNPFHPEH